MDYAFYNGDIAPYDEMKIPLCDRSLYFGDGVYDCMLGGVRGVYQFDEHLARLRQNAELLSIPFPLSDSDVMSVVRRLAKLSELQEYTVYIQLSRISERRLHQAGDPTSVGFLVTVCECSFAKKFEKVDLITLEDIRYKLCNVKSLNLLPSVLAARRAYSEGVEEAVFVRDGIVTECSRSNLFAVRDEKIITHPESRYILPGITRKNVLKKANELGIKCEERCFGEEELLESDGAFITSTTKLLRGVKNISGFPLSGGGDDLIRSLFDAILSDLVGFCC